MNSRPAADALIAALPSALLVIDDQGRVANVNAAAEMLLNASSVHVAGREFSELVRLPTACMDGLREEANFVAHDCVVSIARGGEVRADVHGATIADFPGWRLITLDTQAGPQLLGQGLDRRSHSRSAIGAASMLAHEIKNPLAGIRGAAQLLDAHVREDGAPLTALIRDEVDRVAALIDRMEAFTDVRPVQRTHENIYAILEHARAVARAAFRDRIEILDAYDPSLPTVFVNRDSLVQVLLNLIKNAAECVGEGEQCTVTLTTRYRHGLSVEGEDGRRALPVEVCVIDNGPGPSTEVVNHLFEPFISTKTPGRGLGLALVDKLVRDNGGLVQFAREGEPPRSVFRLLLPRTP